MNRTVRTALILSTLLPLGAADAPPGDALSILDLLASAGWIGWVIVLCSMAVVALSIDQFLGLRRERRLLLVAGERLAGRDPLAHRQELGEWAEREPSLIGRLLSAGVVAQADHRERAIQDEAADYAGRLHRRAEYLLFIGNAAPMLGLLGTVVGMMQSFNVIAGSEGMADPGRLADGISKALVTTCLGLLVALPALAVYTVIRNRIEILLGDAGRHIERLLFPERFQGN